MSKKKTVAIDIASYLKVKPVDIDKFIKVAIGEKVEVDGVLAEKKSFMGVNKTKVCSPIEGVVDSFDFKEGQIVLEVDEKVIVVKEKEVEKKNKPVKEEIEEKKSKEILSEVKTKVKSPVFARASKKKLEEKKVKSQKKSEKKVDVESVELESVMGFGTFDGKAEMVEVFDTKKMNFRHRGKILISNQMPALESFYKADVLGVKGFICNSYKVKEAKKIEKEIKDRIKVGLLILADKYDVEKLDGKKIFVEEGRLVVS